MRTENTIIIHGNISRIFDMAADVLRWPEILPHYRWVKLIEDKGRSRIVEMAASRDGLPVKWTSIQEPRKEHGKIIFRHIKGPTKGMYVEWNMGLTKDGAVQVRITHDFSPNWPVVGQFLAEYVVGRFFVYNIAGKTLGRIKEIIETENGKKRR